MSAPLIVHLKGRQARSIFTLTLSHVSYTTHAFHFHVQISKMGILKPGKINCVNSYSPTMGSATLGKVSRVSREYEVTNESKSKPAML